ncbi:hypothetical protein IEO21_08414 [Rhodonia placenta]|uniref:F-box domain-containing protein n=1 Tax=Rhodonia placenta TaxID=104341 RepID=A0A8H7NWP9_9APHY|nr:hypothetical protein IEO21_08414 [Postia placenta]
MVLDHFVGATPKTLLQLSLVCQHWRTRCSPYLVRNIVFSNRGDVLREYRARRREWKGPGCLIIKGAENTRSLSHVGFVAALFGPIWPNVRDVIIEHGDWRTGDFHPDIFHHLYSLLKKAEALRLHDITFPSGAILRRLVLPIHSQTVESLTELSLVQISFVNASMPPTSLSWMNYGIPSGKLVKVQLDYLDAISLDMIAHWLLVAPDRDHQLLQYIVLSFGKFDEPQHGTIPLIIPFLKTVGDRTQGLALDVTRSLARCLSLPRCPGLITHKQGIENIFLKIHVQESMPYEWLLRAISPLQAPEGPLIHTLRIDFIIDAHFSHGNIVSKGAECEGCVVHSQPARSFTTPKVLDDIMARLKTVCDVLDRVLWNIRDIQVCCCAPLDPGIWMPRLRTWFPKSRKSDVFSRRGL